LYILLSERTHKRPYKDTGKISTHQGCKINAGLDGIIYSNRSNRRFRDSELFVSFSTGSCCEWF
jgi:hypothetical protein